MPEPSLEGPRIVASISQGEAAAVPEHVRVDRKGHAGALAEACDQSMKTLGRHRAAALGSEHVRARRLLALQPAQGADLVTLDWVDAWCASFTPADVQASGIELDLVPFQIADFGGPKTMSVSRLDLRAAAISFSSSAPVRYSQVRPTEEFTMVGGVVLSASKAMKVPIPRLRLRNQ